jgi:hypothetical protein
MSKIGEHAHAQRLVTYALGLLSHYVSTEGTLVRGWAEHSEKVSLDGKMPEGLPGKGGQRFVSIRSTAAVVLHNVAVEMLLLAEVPQFGDSLGRSAPPFVVGHFPPL